MKQQVFNEVADNEWELSELEFEDRLVDPENFEDAIQGDPLSELSRKTLGRYRLATPADAGRDDLVTTYSPDNFEFIQLAPVST